MASERVPRTEIAPEPSLTLTPPTVPATAVAERAGKRAMSSRVTVAPDAPPSLSMSGTL